MFREEGISAFYSAFIRCNVSQHANDLTRSASFLAITEGITPRVARVAPGQAVVFAVYEKVKKYIDVMVSMQPARAG